MKFTRISCFILLSISLCSFSCLTAQEERKRSEFWSKVRYGGGIGLGFGNGFFSGTITPSAIYEFNDQFATGLGLNFTYFSERDLYSSTIVGGSVITLYNVIPEIQLSAEFEQLNENRNYDDDFFPQTTESVDTNFWYSALFFGAGFRTQNITVGMRYDVLYDEDRSIYGTAWLPFVRVFF